LHGCISQYPLSPRFYQRIHIGSVVFLKCPPLCILCPMTGCPRKCQMGSAITESRVCGNRCKMSGCSGNWDFMFSIVDVSSVNDVRTWADQMDGSHQGSDGYTVHGTVRIQNPSSLCVACRNNSSATVTAPKLQTPSFNLNTDLHSHTTFFFFFPRLSKPRMR
jgi:hypothetical protein